jgi:hypothetical protein
MTIETKYNIGEKVYWLSPTKVSVSTIVGIYYQDKPCWDVTLHSLEFFKARKRQVTYLMRTGSLIDEERLFPTKEELLKSL